MNEKFEMSTVKLTITMKYKLFSEHIITVNNKYYFSDYIFSEYYIIFFKEAIYNSKVTEK